MAAKNKFKGRGRDSNSREDADLQDLLGLHFQACRRAEEVEEQIEELHAAGKFPEARVLRMQAFGIQQGLRSIEAQVRSVVRPPTPRQPRTAPNAALMSAGRSLAADFEAAMDAGISLEVLR
ncbi:MAG: hypothetical protein JSR66_23060 [Proteobacteria bacterium]|nr:hypothetical protein [Pseudomonadota bacterium]